MRVFSQSCFTVSKHVMASIHFYLNILKEYFISPFVLIFCVFNFSFLMKSLGVKLKFLGEKPVKLQTRVFYYCFAKFYHTSEKKNFPVAHPNTGKVNPKKTSSENWSFGLIKIVMILKINRWIYIQINKKLNNVLRRYESMESLDANHKVVYISFFLIFIVCVHLGWIGSWS